MFRRMTIIAAVISLVAVSMIPAVAKAPAGNVPIFPLAKQSGLTTLATAIQVAELVGVVNGGGPYTVFAPTNEAFAALGEETLNAVLADKALLTSILLYHVATEELVATDVLSRSSIDMATGESVSVDASMVKVNDANIIATDIMAKNGVVHVIDKVLLPPSLTSSLKATKGGTISAPAGAALFNISGDETTETKSWGEMKSQYSK